MRTTAAADGVVLVDKPAGMTSHDVVAVARRALGTRRIGHTGTLDPFATGLLVLLLGKATRLLPYVLGEPKIYDATIALGAETTTDDVTGEVTREAPLPTDAAIAKAIRELTGDIDQRPPDYSAKQVAGRRAYAAARAGRPLALATARVHVYGWTVRARAERTLEVTISCAGGTYVRALARDLGRAANSAAHLQCLRRTRAGVFDVADAVTVEMLRGGDVAITPLRAAIPHLTTRSLDDDDLRRVRHGNDVLARDDALLVALLDAHGEVVALAEREGERLRPRVVLQDA